MSIAEGRAVVKAQLDDFLPANGLGGMDSVPCIDAGMVFERAGGGDGDKPTSICRAFLWLRAESGGEKKERERKETSESHANELSRMVAQ